MDVDPARVQSTRDMSAVLPSLRIDRLYAAAACTVVLLSHRRQRRSFYYAGLLNLATALFLIADHRAWFNRPAWAVIAAGLDALGAGLLLDRRERAMRR